MTTFILPIGDYIGYGHERYEEFLIDSSLPFEEVEQAQKLILEKTGINVYKICSGFEENQIKFSLVKKLNELGFDFSNEYDFNKEVIDELMTLENPQEAENEYAMLSTVVQIRTIATVWLFLLNYVNPELKLKFNENIAPKVLSPHSHDDTVGYGCFDE